MSTLGWPCGATLVLLSGAALGGCAMVSPTPHEVASPQAESHATSERVEIASGEWRLFGDLVVPQLGRPAPGVILLNKAAGNRTAYEGLAAALAREGIASLRIDLRGHGESIGLGKFVPFESLEMIADSYLDVEAADAFLRADRRIDGARIGFVGASYSGESMMEAARHAGYGVAYAALSPGSLSDESIAAIDREHLPFLLVVARHERHLKEVVAALREQSREAELLELSGSEHATRLLGDHPDLAERLALWLRLHLAEPARTEGTAATQ